MDNKKIKKHIIFIIIAVFLVLFFVGFMVYYYDPFFHYHAPRNNFAYVVDNQLTQNPGMAEHMEYDSVILGSSMTVNFETDWFKELASLNTLKLSYSSAYPKDISNILEKIYKPYDDGRAKDIKAVFLGLDIITYSGDVNETKYPLPEYLYDDNPVNDINYLLNKDVFLNYVLRPLVDPEPTNLSTVYSSWWTDEFYNEEWVLRNHESPEKKDVELSPFAFNEGIIRNLDVNIIPYIEAHPETDYYIFFPPYSILFWDDVLIDNRFEATINAYECVEEKLNGFSNVHMYYFPSDEEIVTDLNNYADYSHYKPAINRYMAESFFDGNDYVAKTSEDGHKMSYYLDEMRRIVDEYDFSKLENKLSMYR